MRLAWGLLGSCLVLVITAPAVRAGKGIDGVININTAEPPVLGLLPGVGPAKAAQIVAYRKRHPFRTVDELVRIKGIGRKMVRRLRVHLAVAGPTTATGAGTPGAVAPPAPPAPRPAPPPARPPPPRFVCARPGVPVRCPVKPVPRRAARPIYGVCPRAP